jgi:hypothetical protein
LNPEFSSDVENGGDCTRVSAPCDTLEAGTIFIWNAPDGLLSAPAPLGKLLAGFLATASPQQAI